ncbi:DUF742 domain-containing protein [Krasilnikovia sp. MM14-A1004]|uniref:DUF742 domain-containing protein n=1 Tax=Krasilnikovia sp. MM14-A1004 TaxID=3373541 RepID=UPI00399C73C8
MTSDDSTGTAGGRPGGVRFDGWTDYREWAARDFRSRGPGEEAGTSASNVFVVEVLTHLAPITLPEMPGLERAPERCRIGPDRSASDCRDEDLVDVRLEIDVEAALIRPYVRAGGRVETAHPLQIESLLSSTGVHHHWAGEPDLDDDEIQLCENCMSPQSVAELAVALHAPVGLVKVLIGDAIDRGLLMMHKSATTGAGRPPVALLKRVHASLANLA